MNASAALSSCSGPVLATIGIGELDGEPVFACAACAAVLSYVSQLSEARLSAAQRKLPEISERFSWIPSSKSGRSCDTARTSARAAGLRWTEKFAAKTILPVPTSFSHKGIDPAPTYGLRCLLVGKSTELIER